MAPISIDGFGDCDVESQIIDLCQFEASTELDFFLQDGLLEWYEAGGSGDGDGDGDYDPGNPDIDNPPGDTGPDPVFCNPCAAEFKSYAGSYPELFTVGGESTGAIYCGSVTITINDPSLNPDNDGKTGIKLTITSEDGEGGESCCCTGTPSQGGVKTWILSPTQITLGDLRGNVDNKKVPACDGCGCQEEDTSLCYGSFNEACPGLTSVLDVMLQIEKNNCL